jgi:hypothetical protein
MAQVGLTLDFSGYTGDLIVVWYKATSPLTEVDRSAAMPFPVSEVITAENLDPEVYTFKFFQSDNGVALTTLLRSWSIDASAFGDVTVQQYEYVCDRGSSGTDPFWEDPVTGDTQIVDERLDGAAQSDCELYTEGKGKRLTADWEMLSGGGVKLLATGDAFDNGQAIFVSRFSRGTSSTDFGGLVGSSDYADVIDLSADDAFDTTHKNKLINCTGSNPVTTYTLLSLATMPDCKLKFSTHGMSGNYLTIQLAGSDIIPFWGSNRSAIHLGKGEWIEILIKSNVAYILSDGTGYQKLGKRDLVDAAGLNQKLLDGLTEYQIDEWPRIADYIASLPSNMIITVFASWTPTYGVHKFYYNESGGVFRLPDDRNMHYRALSTFAGGTDAERYGTSGIVGGTNSNTPGAYQADEIKAHTHNIPLLAGSDSGGGAVVSGNQTGNDGNEPTSSSGGTETRGKNVGQYAVINI